MEALLAPFRRRPLRSGLLLLQVFLSALVMTLALSAAFGSRTEAAPPERFNLVAGSESENSYSTYSVFAPSDLPELERLAPDVLQLAIAADMYSPTVIVGPTRYAFRAGARVSAGYFELEPLTLTAGSFFTASEISAGESVALVSEGAAAALFGTADPLGQTFALEAEHFDPESAPPPPTSYRVVGTFARRTADTFSDQPAVYFPLAGGESFQTASTLSVLAAPGRGEAARAQLLSAARERYAEELRNYGAEEGGDFMIKTPGEISFAPSDIDPDLLVFGLFGIVALMVSSIALFSATVIEAEERAFEIGVRRALGASAARIGRSLIYRALGVALVGGAAGIGAAALLIPLLALPARSAALFRGLELTFDPLAALTVLAVLGVTSGLLGLVPALRIARLKPVQALRDTL